jgi:hypothetical protein
MALYLANEDRVSLVKTRAFVYRWTHIPSGKWYVGSRTAIGSHPEDGYFCSSRTVKAAIIQNPSEWKREILAIGEPKDMLELEARYLTRVNAKQDTNSYNLHNGDGKFTTVGSIQDPVWLANRIAAMTGVKKPVGFGAKVGDRRRGAKASTETRKLIGLSSAGRIQSPEARLKNSEKNSGERNPSFAGYYIDPTGKKYDSPTIAGHDYDVSYATIKNWAKNNKNGWSFRPKGKV